MRSNNQAQSEYKHSLTFRVRVCCHSNKTRAPIAKPPNSAQTQGTPYPSPKYLRPCSSVAMRPRTDTHTDTRDQYTFRVVYTHAKCNDAKRFQDLLRR